MIKITSYPPSYEISSDDFVVTVTLDVLDGVEYAYIESDTQHIHVPIIELSTALDGLMDWLLTQR